MWGMAALWSPILHYETAAQRLFLFYCESRKVRTPARGKVYTGQGDSTSRNSHHTVHQVASPGGDIKLITTDDLGVTWSAPVTLLTHEHDGGVPKVLANKLCIVPSTGAWVLPFW
jgi:hypothetical protein